MSSPNDDIQLKKGDSSTYWLRAKDTSAAQDGTKQTARHLSMPYPVDYGSGGCFHLVSKSGLIAAGASANAPIYSFRWTSSTMLAILRRIRFQAWSVTGFTAGLGFLELYRCTGWSAADTGGTTDTLTGDNGNLRTAMPASLVPEIRHANTGVLTAGTRTKDAQPFESHGFNITNAANTIFTGATDPHKLFEKLGAEHPMIFVQNEGFTLQQSVPATGTWTFALTAEWDEVPALNY